MTRTTRLHAHAVEVGYGPTTVLKDVDFAVPDRAVTAIIGPNGCGKSTLLKTLGRTLRPRSGQVTLDGTPIRRMAPRSFATAVATLPQSPTAPEGITVTDLVARGRQPHQSWLRQWSREDEERVQAALRRTGTEDWAHRPLDELSGGQRQRAWLAFALAQDTDILLLDEPTSSLDLAHAIDVLTLVHALHRELERTVVMVVHDLNLAARYAHHLVVMGEGRIIAEGPPEEVLSAQLLEDVFGLRAQVLANPIGRGILVVPADR
ncbi:ABC transporter ATP-binding protein [Aeromicrobium sp. YIM 150415]|uniref:ABC transporter ATP-binding protein n=1 Tax=Aeromicrobium sp. YIM 150415 TaxID=2803912 RepID=UPI001962CFF9|nr:ABC transporter ATP-binding protein [Aeromicrobium sp. YIM 150415]MBM9465152.1 ABC transporter ATP-binding protein [Aeromicrobium sp. YIM 150415]